MTKREELIAALIQSLSDAPDICPVYRSREQAFSHEELPVLVITRGKESVNDRNLGYIDRTCEVLVSVFSKGNDPETEADTVLEKVHPLVMTFSGYDILSIDEIGTNEPDYEFFDENLCRVMVRYAIRYRTTPNTL